MARLEDKIVLIAGAAGAIGQAVAAAVKREGGVAVATDLARHGGIDHALDVTAESDWHRVLAEVERAHGRLDGLVNAAGIANTDWADQVSLADWKRVLEVNLTGSFIVCRACLPQLRGAGGGTIVNFASGQGLAPFKQRSAYAASKAGVISLTRSLAMEWAPQVRVNTVCPGAVDTPMVRGGYSAEQLREQVGPRYALGRIGEPHEIALAALYLSSAESSFVTGIVLAVDGGRSYH